MPDGDRLPDEIVLTRQEATAVLFALDEGMEHSPPDSDARHRLEVAAQTIVEKFLPDFRDL